MSEASEKMDFQTQSPYLLGKLEGRLEEQEKRIDRQDETFSKAVETIHERIDKKHTEVMSEFKDVGLGMTKITEKQDGMQKWIYGLLLTGALAIMTIELGVIRFIGAKLIGE